MTGSPLKKFVFTPVVLSAAVFGTLTLPLALLGSKPVAIQLQQEQVFQGQLRDVATPYLGLATVLSFGAGLASVAVTGWRMSTRKSSLVEAQLSDLEQNLKEKEAQLEALNVSEPRLEASGLSAFVDETIPLVPVANSSAASQGVNPVVEALVITPQRVEAQAVVPSPVTVQAAAAKFAVAQTFLGYAQAKASVEPANQVTELASSQVEELHIQLQQIMAQMASVQTALSATRSPVKPSEQVPASSGQQQVVKSWAVHEMAS